jgi:hypothetical protein
MNKVDKYYARARHCMEMADRTQHDEDKRSWLLLAATWVDMIRACGGLQPIDPEGADDPAASSAFRWR